MNRDRRRSLSDRIFRALVRLFPVDFRADHGHDLEQTLRAQHTEARREGSVRAFARLWLDIVHDIVATAPREHVVILKQDVGYALRALRRAPVFAISAVLTLAIGMSAMTGMVSIVNAVMLRPLPVDHPEEIVSISNRNGFFPVSYPDLQDYRARKDVLADAIGYSARLATLSAEGGSDRVLVTMVTDNYFSMLGVQPAAGRLIQPNEGRAPGDAAVLVLDYRYWQSRFGGDPSIVGKQVRISRTPFTVVGVAARSFRGTESLVRVSAYVPAWMNDAFTDYPPDPRAPSIFADRAARRFNVLARLQQGVSLAQARADLDIRAAGLAREFPSTHKDVSLRVVPETETRPSPELGSFLHVASTALAGLAVLVLLITSANVANLLMARAAGRGREVTLRAALGARRGRIMRQFITEGVTLALLGGLTALPIVAFAMSSLQHVFTSVSAAVAIEPDFSVDRRVVAVAFLMSIAAGIVAGLAPALQAGRTDLNSGLRSGARGTSEASGWVRTTLVVAQVALSLTLLVSGGLFLRSLHHARGVDLGFNPDGMFLASASPGIQGYDDAQRLAFFQRVRDQVAALPGIDRAAWTSIVPMAIISEMALVSPEVRPSDPGWRPPAAFEYAVSPEYFTTAGMQVLQGRGFSERDDASAAPVAIVNETLAREFWPNESALGRRFTADDATLEVVGVVRNGKYLNIGEAPRAALFTPLAQTVPSVATLAVRSSRPPSELATTIRETMRLIDPEVAVYDVRLMATHLDNSTGFFPFRLGAFMTSLFGAMGMLLASVGLYGMIAYHVGQRTQEIGVRMALGARASDIIRDVLARGGRSAVIGIAIGIVLSGGIAQLLKGLLLGISPFDPVTYAGVAGLLIAICLFASFLPARRATTVDPLVALRAD